MSGYLLDTDTIVSLLRGREAVLRRARAVGVARVATSVICMAELYYGVYRSNRVEENARLVDVFRERVTVLDFDTPAAVMYGRIKAELTHRRSLLADTDLLIAAVALASGLILVTHNRKHFGRITGLSIEDWLEEAGRS